MQVDLACTIFQTVWGKPSESRFIFVGHYDWSQGHAAMPPDALNAERMLVGTGGLTATHLRPTSWPYTVNGHQHSIPRALLCEPNCVICKRDYEKYGKPGSPNFDPSFQSIGVKGLKVVLEERGLLQQGWHQPEMVQALQKCSDFQKKDIDIIERAAVTAQMQSSWQSYGYIALFGVKYHAELAHVERKWMLLKRAIRSKLDGTLPTLKRLLRDAWPRYTVGDARKAARHCRVSMKAYMVLGNTDLDTLREEELKMKGHRRVFDSVVGRFVIRAGLQQSARDQINIIYALRTEKARVHRLAKQEYDKRKELEWGSMLKRRARHSISDEDKIERNWNTKVRKASSVITKKIAGEIVPEQTIKWATNILEKYHHD